MAQGDLHGVVLDGLLRDVQQAQQKEGLAVGGQAGALVVDRQAPALALGHHQQGFGQGHGRVLGLSVLAPFQGRLDQPGIFAVIDERDIQLPGLAREDEAGLAAEVDIGVGRIVGGQ
ncbi:hypothetical protein D9M69_526120 [compost metagenome]